MQYENHISFLQYHPKNAKYNALPVSLRTDFDAVEHAKCHSALLDFMEGCDDELQKTTDPIMTSNNQAH